jgi:tRNA dimethylallyltransferase
VVESEVVYAVVGATATGKTDLAEALADRLDAEIVCADSRQVFRELEIGTGKPTRAQIAGRPHHLFDARSIGERASAGWYAREASRVIGEIRSRGRRPLLVGGAGLYLRALQEGLTEEPVLDEAARAERRAAHAATEVTELHGRLRVLDPASAARLRPRDRQRISRALEVVELSGKPIGWWHAQPSRPPVAGEWRIVELRVAAGEIPSRIERRTAWMFAHGLPEEVSALVAAGLEPALRALRAVGYDEALDLLAGLVTREDAERRTSERTRQLARRQRTWFRHQIAADVVEFAGDEPPLEEALRWLDSRASGRGAGG